MTEPCTGVLLAAGRGRRMGGRKQLTPWPPDAPTSTLVATAFDALAAQCEAMVVVVGHLAAAVHDALGTRAYLSVDADPDAPMFESIRAGLAAVPAGRSVLLHPADHPMIPPAVGRAIAAAATPAHAVMPEINGRGGHPVWIPAAIVGQLRGAEAPDGLRGWWRDHPGCVRRVAVADDVILHDIDEPADVERYAPSPD